MVEVQDERRRAFGDLMDWMYDEGAKTLDIIDQGGLKVHFVLWAGQMIVIHELTTQHGGFSAQFYVPMEGRTWQDVRNALDQLRQ